MRIIPVLDVMSGRVVHARGGQRKEYLPLISRLTQSTNPFEVARAMIKAASAKELYVADLDAIQGESDNGDAVRKLLRIKDITIWSDAGYGCRMPTVADLANPRLIQVIGFETCPTINDFLFCFHAATPDRVCFSIDLRNGELIGDWKAWDLKHGRDCLGLARAVVGIGCRRLIVLDLAQVGTGKGCGTEGLLQRIRSEFPCIELVAGGGIRSAQDMEALASIGVNAALIASAIHNLQV